MAELADALGLGPSGETRGGSSPPGRTQSKNDPDQVVFFVSAIFLIFLLFLFFLGVF